MEILNETGGGYNPDTGRHEPPVTQFTVLPCNVSSLGIDRRRALFGDFDVERIVVRLQQPYEGAITKAIVEGKAYKLTQHNQFNPRTAFYLEEIQ